MHSARFYFAANYDARIYQHSYSVLQPASLGHATSVQQSTLSEMKTEFNSLRDGLPYMLFTSTDTARIRQELGKSRHLSTRSGAIVGTP